MFSFRKITAALLLTILSFPALAGSPNITGTVTADGKPLAGVAVSDGCKIVLTDKKGHYGVVFKRPFMVTQNGQYKGYPFRTFSNGKFINGYSDHFPTYIVVGK